MIYSEASGVASNAHRTTAAYTSAKPKDNSPLVDDSSTNPSIARDERSSPRFPPDASRSTGRENLPGVQEDNSRVYDPAAEREAQVKRLSELAQSLDEALKRINQFFRPEDLSTPPGPIEIQRRVVAANNPLPDSPTERAQAEQNRNPKPNLRDDIQQQAESPLDVVV
jgi:hypothetical protein